ncbi:MULTISPECIES: threonine/serine exporter family protein [unclassified Microbacterium]|uniref:threonine/serine ThrE exporter family protein n=1 Tax=unclassified Microbacterium TaxID=2609290 RepID=UPI000A68D738|nr:MULTISPECIES: threonine/serine exporter family protein [unclassified Microbacterium]MBN9225638.1 threonine/serine exporter family protein [Microbacterium sp.]
MAAPASPSDSDDGTARSSPDTDTDTDTEGTLTQELRLEPVQFIARTDVVMRLGALMLGAGASSARVRDSMERAAHAVGIETLHVRVGMNDLVATMSRGQMFRTRVAEIPRPGVDAERLTALKRLTSELAPGTSAAAVQARMDAVEARPRRYPDLVRVLGAGLACAAFALLNNGGWQEFVAVLVAASAGQFVRMRIARLRTNEFLTVFASAVVALLVYLGVAAVLAAAGLPGGQHDAAVTSAVLYLVPGFPLVTGALDLARLDLNAGISRVVYATLVLLATGTAVWGIATVFHAIVTQTADPLFAEPLLSVVRLIAGFIGVLGFAVLFDTPPAIAVTAAALGAVANAGRLALVDGGMTPPLAAAIAALAVGFGAFLFGNRLRAARVTLTVPAVLIMVPGAAAYRAITGVISGDTLAAVQNGFTAVFVVVALAIGLTLARILTEREWSIPAR